MFFLLIATPWPKKQVTFVYLAFLYVTILNFQFFTWTLRKLYFSLVRMPEASIIVIALTKPFSAFPSVNGLCNDAAAASSVFCSFFSQCNSSVLSSRWHTCFQHFHAKYISIVSGILHSHTAVSLSMINTYHHIMLYIISK